MDELSQNPEPDDLDWLAFRYIAEELSDDEREAFEVRLAEEQPAREAVARAVEMSLAVQDVLAEDAAVALAKTESPERNRRGWLNVALAAGGVLALALVVKFVNSPAKPPVANGQHVEDLAIIWSETRGVWPTSAWSAEDEDALLATASDDELAAAPPTWMVAAVSQSDKAMPEEHDGEPLPQ